MSNIKSACLCCLLSLLLLACNFSDNTEFKLQEAWINEPVPGQTRTAGYFTLLNQTNANLQLVGAKADIAGRIELHTLNNSGGMMRMRRLDSVVVPAQQKLIFSPGQTHLMLLDLDTSLLSKKTVSVTLLFYDNKQLVADFQIRRLNGGKKTSGHHY